MNWLLLTTISYLILAVVNLGDKFVVDKLLSSSKAYAFIVALLSALAFVLAPWFLTWPGIFLFIINLITGALFVFALWAQYEALKRGEASRVVVVIGSIIPVFTILFSILFFKESFRASQWWGLLFLLAGMFLISFVLGRRSKFQIFLKRLGSVFTGGYQKKWIFLSITASFLYALFFILSKYAYQYQEFLSSFIWIKLGGLLVVLLFLIDRESRQEIFKSFKEKPRSRRIKKKKEPNKIIVFLNQILGSLGFVLQNYAVYLGPVAIINALQGIQYAFLLVLGIFFSIFFPKILKEDISKNILIKKIIAIILVGIGLYFIAV